MAIQVRAEEKEILTSVRELFASKNAKIRQAAELRKRDIHDEL